MPGRNVDRSDASAYDAGSMSRRVRFILTFLAFAPLSQAQDHRCDLMSLQAKAVLDQRFSGWRPKVLFDLRGYDKKLWLKMHSKECPGIAGGHFESSDRLAYAVLLVPKAAEKAGYKIIVLSKPAGEYDVRLLDQANGTDDGLVVSKAPRGRHSGFGDEKSVRLTLDGVNVEWLEKSSTLYYWSKGKYQNIPTSD
jgi:hypothetical protein